MVKTGIDVLLSDEDELGRFRDRSVGLITNQTGVTGDLDYNREVLVDRGIDLAKLYSPEHGIWGVHGAGETVSDYTDDLTDITVHSLYGEHRVPTAEMLDGIDLLAFDIQDAGPRCWTYTATMINGMRAAAEHDLPYAVLDRPAPLTGELIDGRPVDPGFDSFVGHRGLPMVYGLTIGELAGYANEEYDVGADLHVVELQGWDRGTWFDETGLLWGPSAPALFELEKALVYPGTVLVEGTNVSSGDARHGPLMMAAPWMEMAAVVERGREVLASHGLDAARLRKAKFRADGEINEGFQIHVADRETFRPFATGVALLGVVAAEHPGAFEFTNPDHFDRLAGTDAFRERLETGASIESLLALAAEGIDEYRDRRDPYLRYGADSR